MVIVTYMHLVSQRNLHLWRLLTTDISASFSYPHFVSRVPQIAPFDIQFSKFPGEQAPGPH